MARKFDMSAAFAAAVGDVSKSDTGREEIEYLDLALLREDPGNFYSLDHIDELAANIQLCGLQQPIRVRAAEDGGYTIVSGHRRRAALSILAEEEPDRWNAVPCIVERDEASPELRELRLILANSSTRVLSPAEVAKQAQQVETLLYQLKEQGYTFPGRMRDQVAVACKVSAPKLARLKVIREKLVPEWLSLFDRDALPEQTAYAMARMPQNLQERLFRVCGSNPPTGGSAERLLEAASSGAEWEPRFSCPDGSPCRRGDTFLRHDAENPFEMCFGETCCLMCSRAKSSCYACDRMCAKAKALRKEGRDDAARAEEERREKQQREYRSAIQHSAARLLKAAEAAGLDDSVEINPRTYYAAVSVADLRAYAAGEFGEKYFYSNDLAPGNLDHPEQIAKTLRCSADYVLGLTEELHPSGVGEDPWHWWPEEPKEDGLYWCVKGPLHRGGALYWWSAANRRWEDPAAGGFALNVDVKLWMVCPALPESMAWERGEA